MGIQLNNILHNMEQAKLSFCTPVYNDGDAVSVMIESILDQDYKNIEHILVNDGSKDKTKSVLDKYAKKYPDRIKVLHFSTNRGACIARNEAAKHATGKYISFLPADAKLFPGVARIWVEELEKNPEYDFFYGGYSFVNEAWNKIQGGDYTSEEFDPYFLEVTNYIDGSFPLKKELFDKMGGWDSSIKSLQDWDFWLNAVIKHKAKGLYLPELFFETTLPHPGGLSFDSANNWIDRTNQIKRKYNIRDREICVCSFGAPFHGRNTAKLLNADYKNMPSFKPHKYKMIYLVGGYYQNFPLIVDAFKYHDGLRVIHWIGSDVMQLLSLKNDARPTAAIALSKFLEFIANNVDVNLCEYEQTAKELKQFGIKAKIVPLPPAKLYKPEKFPEKFTIAVYLPYINKGFYFPDLIMEVAAKMKDVNWKIFGDQTLIGNKDNIEHVGKIDYEKMGDFIKDCSAILRLTPHDGLPLSVCEFITAGRNAITSTPMPFVIIPKEATVDNIIKAVDECKKLPDNIEGSKYYTKLLDHKKYKNSIYKLMEYKPHDYWEKRARSWDIIKGNNLTGDSAENEKKYLEFIEKSIEKVKKETAFLAILDVGCGNGNWYHWLRERGDKYLGIDISKKLVEIAQKKYGNNFMNMDLMDLGYELRNIIIPNKYDLAFSFTTLLHVKPENIKLAIDEIGKVAKYGIFVEPIKKQDRTQIGSRILHPELVRDIYSKGYILQGIESSFVHEYEKYFNIIDSEEIGARKAYFVKF